MATRERLQPPFRAEHVGSLLRPSKLRQAFRAYTEGDLDPEAFREVQDECIREVVSMQESIGLRGITDGEFRRASYWSHFVEGTEGLEVREARFDFHDAQGKSSHFLAPHACGRLRRTRSLSGDELDFLRTATSCTPKTTMPSPPTMHFWAGPSVVRSAGYEDDEAFFEDLAQVYREEIADLAGRGATYLQLDEVPLAMLCDGTIRDGMKARGEDPDRLVESYLRLINGALEGRPAGLTVGMHLCQGNFKGMWLSEGGYQYLAERLFNEIEVDAFFLEYDTPRTGDFGALRSVPDDRRIVLGLVCTKIPRLESADELCRRIDEASRFVALERLSVSPQCGFASAVSGNPVGFDDEVKKLELIVDVAQRVWGQSAS